MCKLDPSDVRKAGMVGRQLSRQMKQASFSASLLEHGKVVIGIFFGLCARTTELLKGSMHPKPLQVIWEGHL